MYLIIKRFFDVIISLLTLLILSPLLIPIAIGLRLTGEGYIWYLQERVGYKNKVFNIYKFATMLKDSPNMAGGLITTKKDPRLTPMGGFLRDTKINELPQILNILNGDMSFVGPRPVMKKSFETYSEEIQKIIYNVKPGLTGIGSIVFRDEERILSDIKNEGKDPWEFYKNSIYPFKGELERWYQQNQSFLTDFKILLITFWVIIFPDSKVLFFWFPKLPKRQF
ncbi:MAG: sugar transferase [Saprospiraceae bacterium]|nr:sugar transferase [Saprospiraceae bacterium]